MTKHLKIEVSLPLHDELVPQAKQIVASDALVKHIEAGIAEHLPGAVVTHAIASPEPPARARKPRATKPEVKPVGPAFDPTDGKNPPAEAKLPAKKAA